MVSRALHCVLLLLGLTPSFARAQREVASTRSTPASSGPAATSRVALASRAASAPVIDGKADDAVWSTAQVFTEFRTFDPVENGDPRFRTEARVAYDDHNLYVLVRAYDPHPDSLIALLSRRDVRTQSDW